MMTDDERDALIEELAEAIHGVNLARTPKAFSTWEAEQSMASRHSDMVYVTHTREQAAACLSIIDRLLAAHDLDGMLGRITLKGCKANSISHSIKFTIEGDGYRARLNIMGAKHAGNGWYEPASTEYIGTAPKRMAAIRAAIAQAHGSTNGETK